MGENSFVTADRIPKARAVEPKMTETTIPATRHPRQSECVPRRADVRPDSHAPRYMECGNAECEATHEGHYPYRHSVSCKMYYDAHGKCPDTSAAYDEAESEPSPSAWQSVPSPPAPRDSLQERISSAYQRAEDMHHSHHIVEHLAAGASGHKSHELLEVQDASRASMLADTLPKPASSPSKYAEEVDVRQRTPLPIVRHQAVEKTPGATSIEMVPEIHEMTVVHVVRHTHEISDLHSAPELKDSRGLPKVRLSTTPPWLKDPQTSQGASP